MPAASSAALALSLPLLRSCFSISSIPNSVVTVGELLVSALPLTTIFSQLKKLMGWEIFWMLVIEYLLLSELVYFIESRRESGYKKYKSFKLGDLLRLLYRK